MVGVMTSRNPLSSRCTATAKGSGQRCQQYVIGGGVCFKHGGAAKQVARARRDRVRLAEAFVGLPRRNPAEVFTDALHGFDVLMQQARAEIEDDDPNPETVAKLVVALEQAARWSKVGLDAEVDQRQAAVSEAQVSRVVGAVQRAIAAEVRDAATRERLANRIRIELGGGSPAARTIEGTHDR